MRVFTPLSLSGCIFDILLEAFFTWEEEILLPVQQNKKPDDVKSFSSVL